MRVPYTGTICNDVGDGICWGRKKEQVLCVLVEKLFSMKPDKVKQVGIAMDPNLRMTYGADGEKLMIPLR